MNRSQPSVRPRLNLEELEPRESPSASPWATDTFDGAKIGSLPIDWSAHGSDNGLSAFVVSAATLAAPAYSGSNFLAVNSTSTTVGADRACRETFQNVLPKSVTTRR